MRISPLPPMNSLVVFESAGRHLSFTKSAEELNVTQGAVSRQIRQLEDYLGTPLFVRNNRHLTLTPAGLKFYQTVRNALIQISDETSVIKKWHGDNQVTVITSSALASLWLLPKVADIQHELDIDLRILTMENMADLHKVNFDMALYYCRKPPHNMQATKLFPEEITPVCNPKYLEQFGDNATAEQILSKTILDLDDSQQDWHTWRAWFDNAGLSPIKPKNRIHINNYPMLIQSAVRGQGIALGWLSLLDEHLQRGELVCPINSVLKTSESFCLLELSERTRLSYGAKQFKQWLLSYADGL